jgi:hypothetical protein
VFHLLNFVSVPKQEKRNTKKQGKNTHTSPRDIQVIIVRLLQMFGDGLSWQSNNLSFWLSTLHGLSVDSLEKTAREVHIGGSEFFRIFSL